ncbi:glycosyltransferase [Xenorhabdus bovienii]|uniref:glycosyltransferase n=1 Tax=Xenorhabdus bovienii TaxID=40576 RepID=UPI003DA2C76D
MKILPVIVLYKRELEKSDSFLYLKEINNDTINSIFIYDNSPEYNSSNIENKKNIIYISDINNSGVSKAYNCAAKYANKNGYDWLLLLDQDTKPPHDLIENYISSIHKNPNIPLFSPILMTKNGKICSPCIYKYHRGFSPKKIYSGIKNLNQYSPINSCMLISTQALLDVGGYNENVYLDFSDFQFIERLRKKHKLFYLIDSYAIQDFSNDESCHLKLDSRFQTYCDCATNCSKESMLDHIQYFLMVFFRAIKLTLRTRNIIFLKTFFRYFLLKKSRKN